MPLLGLLYAQVIKQYQRKRMVGVQHRVVFGTLGAIEQGLAPYGWKMNTAFVERLHLDICQRVAAVGRRVNTLCQGEAGLRQQVVLFQVYDNFVPPYASLRQARPQPLRTKGNGSAKVWQPCTPAMAARLPDHVWSLKSGRYVTNGLIDNRGVERLTCVQMQANRANRGLANSFQVRMTG